MMHVRRHASAAGDMQMMLAQACHHQHDCRLVMLARGP